MKLIRLLCFVLVLPLWSSGQSALLDSYLQEAITNSDALKQLQFQLQRNLYALEEAKGLFLPAVNLTGTYTLAAVVEASPFRLAICSIQCTAP
ncbi:MAG: hypothetical protein HC892_22895 [Saprospiraceae bacterium]|nr:hypothetical protein [Saprospiraceae bacterium]